MDVSKPSPVAIAFLDGVADAKGRNHALALTDKAGAAAKKFIDEIIARHGAQEALYVLQMSGEVILGTVSTTLQRLFDSKKH